ncbi:MAG: hypothetical protein LBE70_05000 [Nitrososphaerota archaeon]|jgi:imidazoleglycerol phosphate synthase glutamine amidotransferase subunit HisH|nr:hypothetical protein [Nitrososphaerota archaeon]
MTNCIIFNYGTDNLLSIKCALEKSEVNVVIGTSKQDLTMVDVTVIPVLGHFMFGAAYTNMSGFQFHPKKYDDICFYRF